MRKPAVVTIVLALSLLQAIARESIQEGEQSGIPERADVEKKMQIPDKQVKKQEKREVKENQEDTDPVFYDSTTSPKEMEQKNTEEI